MTNLFTKYNTNAPRYTSYPPVPYWNNKMDSAKWMNYLKKGLELDPEVDLYIHIPFCEKLCWYCGCNRVITKNKDRADKYIDALRSEFDSYLKALGNLKIRSLHFGGGTPNFLTPDQLNDLLSSFAPYFGPDVFEGAIEIDPRTCLPEHLETLASFGFTKISFGIQDFDAQVQGAINRIQPFEMVKGVVELARAKGFKHMNFDLIWGLPKQTQETIARSIELTKQLSPEQVSFYSYAHLPARFKHQRLIKEEDILRGEEKRALYEKGKALLEEAGYLEIGMDHYAKENSILWKASREKKLTRNFMGYAQAKSSTQLGLGASSISNNPFGFAQNEKDIARYQELALAGKIPVCGGHLNQGEDLLRDELIRDLMCNMRISLEKLNELCDKKDTHKKMEGMKSDGLLYQCGEDYLVSETGKVFIRAIASVFDQYQRTLKGTGFSQTV